MKLSPPLAEWSTAAEAVAWLNAETDLEWGWHRVLETLKSLSPETLHVVPPIGLAVAKLDDSGRLDNRTWQYPMLMQVSRADEYLQQLLLGDSFDTATGFTGSLVEPRAGWRAIPTEPIPARALRLSRQEVYSIAEAVDGFDVLVAEINAGKNPELAALLDGRNTEEPESLEEKSEEPEPQAERRKTEINRWLHDKWEADGHPGGAKFFRALRECRGQPGSPIREWWQSGKEPGIEYETSAGGCGKFSRKTLQNKVSEWRISAKIGKP